MIISALPRDQEDGNKEIKWQCARGTEGNDGGTVIRRAPQGKTRET